VRKSVTLLYEPFSKPMGNGEFRPPGEPKLLNRLRWNLAWVITSETPPHVHKTKSVRKGGSFGVGWNVHHKHAFFFLFFFLFFFSFFSFFSFFFGSLNGPTAYPIRIGWALSAPKTCFGGKLIPRGEIPPKSNVPILWGKNPLFNAKIGLV